MEITAIDLVALIGVGAALLGQVYAVWSNRGKTRADEAATLSQMALNIAERSQERFNKMALELDAIKQELAAARAEIAALQEENKRLINRIMELEIENKRLKAQLNA